MLPTSGDSPMNPFVMEVMDDAMSDVLRQKTEVERLRIADRMWKSARVILCGAIRTEHPDWSVDQVNREIARRISCGLVKHESD
jgi:Rv0078B-related antitoxin